jgi:O-antigen ligase
MAIKRNSFLVCISVFVSLTNLFGTKWYYIAVISCLLILLSLVSSFKILFNRYKWLNIFAIAYSISIIISTQLIKDYDVPFEYAVNLASPYVPVMYSLQFICCLFLIEYCNIYNTTKKFISSLIFFLFPFILLCDFLALFSSNDEENFLLGNKFNVTYTHVFFLFIFYYINQYIIKKSIFYKTLFLMIIVITFGMAIKLKCATSIISLFSALFVVFYLKKLYRFLINPLFCVFSIVALDLLFFFFISQILQIPFVQTIVVDVLQKDLTLTTRTNIFDLAFIPLAFRPLWGFGPFNCYAVVPAITGGYPNLQNGILNSVLEIGIIGTVLLLICVYFIIYYSNKYNQYRGNQLFLGLFVFFVIASLVEVTIDNMFLCYISFMLCVNDQKSQKYA